MHIATWFAAAKQRLSCKDIKKLHKPQPTRGPVEGEQRMSMSAQSDWRIHDLSTIFEDAEPLVKGNSSSSATSVISFSSGDNPWSLLDDPTILRLCSSPKVFDGAASDSPGDPRASSKIFVYQHEDSVHSTIISGSTAAEPRDLRAALQRTEGDLVWHSAALRYAHDRLHFLRSENAARLNQTRELTAQVHELERVHGWGKKKLKREITMLTGDLFEQDARLTLQAHRLRELEESLCEWREYALQLEERMA